MNKINVFLLSFLLSFLILLLLYMFILFISYYTNNKFFIKNNIHCIGSLTDYNYRLQFYTQNIFPCNISITDDMLSTDDIYDKPIAIPCNKHFNYNKLFSKKYFHSYFNNIQLFKNIHDTPFIIILGDTTKLDDNITYPLIVKTYSLYNTNNKGVLLPLNIYRHWNPILNVDKNDIPYHHKINDAIWRGSTTGFEMDITKKASRFDLVKKYYNHPEMDIGFNDVIQGNKDNIYDCHVKCELSMKQQLKYKYLIVVEGNDKASCLQWMLYSNSVVLMPKITCVSWFMEQELKPFVHYVPLENDFSDLEEKLEWCKQNDDTCHRISKHARRFVYSFTDTYKERQLIKDVLKIYSKNVKII